MSADPAVRARVSHFYNAFPFPGNLNSYGPWQEQAPSLLRSMGLDPEVIEGATLLDAGCGTGEFSRSFANLGAKVTGVDISSAALERARDLDRQVGLETTEYFEGTLFELPTDENYDVVIALGVLHHTEDPRRAFRSIAHRVRPSGLLIVGLYDRLSRAHILTARRLISLLSGPNITRGMRVASSSMFRPLVRRSVGDRNSTQPQRIADLLVHPHEKPVPIADTLAWFEEEGFDVFGSNPSVRLQDYPRLRWMSGKLPRSIQYLAIELRWLLWLADYYTIAGRRRNRYVDSS